MHSVFCMYDVQTAALRVLYGTARTDLPTSVVLYVCLQICEQRWSASRDYADIPCEEGYVFATTCTTERERVRKRVSVRGNGRVRVCVKSERDARRGRCFLLSDKPVCLCVVSGIHGAHALMYPIVANNCTVTIAVHSLPHHKYTINT